MNRATATLAGRLTPPGKIQLGAAASGLCRKLAVAEYVVTRTRRAIARYGKIMQIQNKCSQVAAEFLDIAANDTDPNFAFTGHLAIS